MTNNETVREVLRWASSFLKEKGKEEAAAERLLMERQNWNKTDLILRLNQLLDPDAKKQLEIDVEQHAKGIPVQYLLGYEWFYDRKFKVTEDTLIPRPETEELVETFLKANTEQKNLRILDIGTGTGIIAITIKKERPDFTVTATDFSKAALVIAEENKRSLDAEVSFRWGDLTQPVSRECFDIVLSNPPYIAEDEIQYMDESVLAYEPRQALFAEHKGLAIYERLAKELPGILAEKGQVYLEIGFQQGAAVQALFAEEFPGASIKIKKDMNGQDRFLVIQLKK
ncbi:MAG: peptide chain release factor N(5)-glutamine methyltransferase [Pisciglobus halotolerans]|nr:peptide chain release factor N(5)-glutamine methyltransferase [Pisciglobus halotolerans]